MLFNGVETHTLRQVVARLKGKGALTSSWPGTSCLHALELQLVVSRRERDHIETYASKIARRITNYEREILNLKYVHKKIECFLSSVHLPQAYNITGVDNRSSSLQHCICISESASSSSKTKTICWHIISIISKRKSYLQKNIINKQHVQ